MAFCKIGRLDDSKLVEVSAGTSISTALETNGFHKQEGEKIQDANGNTYEGGETIANGQSYYLVAQVKSGG